jgi:hypothetical protein
MSGRHMAALGGSWRNLSNSMQFDSTLLMTALCNPSRRPSSHSQPINGDPLRSNDQPMISKWHRAMAVARMQ